MSRLPRDCFATAPPPRPTTRTKPPIILPSTSRVPMSSQQTQARFVMGYNEPDHSGSEVPPAYAASQWRRMDELQALFGFEVVGPCVANYNAGKTWLQVIFKGGRGGCSLPWMRCLALEGGGGSRCGDTDRWVSRVNQQTSVSPSIKTTPCSHFACVYRMAELRSSTATARLCTARRASTITRASTSTTSRRTSPTCSRCSRPCMTTGARTSGSPSSPVRRTR